MNTLSSIRCELNLPPRQAGGFAGDWIGSGPINEIHSPIDGSHIGTVISATRDDLEIIINRSTSAFNSWRTIPAPRRGAVVRELGNLIREYSESLAQLVTLEMGKSIREARGEVQEMIDICEFAAGLSRQLYGLTMPSERTAHRLQEQWHPLGTCAVITAFNFPIAVWGWNVALSLVCGNSVIWKPSSRTPLSAIACSRLAHRALQRFGYSTELCSLVIGAGADIGEPLVTDSRIDLVSYTGSVDRGREVGKQVQARFGRHILELGGNNAVIVSEKADLGMAVKAVYFGAVGTAGQRCTSTRRVVIHESIYQRFLKSLVTVYEKTVIGDPRDEQTLMGPVVSQATVAEMQQAITAVEHQGGRIVCGGQVLDHPGGCYVTPCIAEVTSEMPIVKEETFAPLLYVMPYRRIEDGISKQNDVPQGLSSAIMTNDMAEAELFVSAAGSDCGMANINTGTNGAEIGGAFGGEKETGGGRESGSDAWKAYMRRQTSAINFSGKIELAQGIHFECEPVS
jgi:L-aminoadipate-semialdehyde dehydrogenase